MPSRLSAIAFRMSLFIVCLGHCFVSINQANDDPNQKRYRECFHYFLFASDLSRVIASRSPALLKFLTATLRSNHRTLERLSRSRLISGISIVSRIDIKRSRSFIVLPPSKVLRGLPSGLACASLLHVLCACVMRSGFACMSHPWVNCRSFCVHFLCVLDHLRRMRGASKRHHPNRRNG